MPHPLVFNVPVEQSLELVASIGPDRADPKRELFDHVVDEIDRAVLIVTPVNLERSNRRLHDHLGRERRRGKKRVERRILLAARGEGLFEDEKDGAAAINSVPVNRHGPEARLSKGQGGRAFSWPHPFQRR